MIDWCISVMVGIVGMYVLKSNLMCMYYKLLQYMCNWTNIVLVATHCPMCITASSTSCMDWNHNDAHVRTYVHACKLLAVWLCIIGVFVCCAAVCTCVCVLRSWQAWFYYSYHAHSHAMHAQWASGWGAWQPHKFLTQNACFIWRLISAIYSGECDVWNLFQPRLFRRRDSNPPEWEPHLKQCILFA